MQPPQSGERGTPLGQNDLVDSPKLPGSFRSIVYVPVPGEGPLVSLPSGAPAISICCPDTGDRCTIEDGPSVHDFAAGIWKYVCPSCGEEHQQRYGRATLDDPYYRRTIDIPFDLDLGELVKGQHIVLRGNSAQNHVGFSSPLQVCAGLRPRRSRTRHVMGTRQSDR